MTPRELKTIALVLCVFSQLTYAQQSKPLKENHQQTYAEFMGKSTLVYPNSKKDTVAVLQLAYPHVARKFLTLYPNAINDTWIKESDVLYVSFMNNNRKVSAVFTTGGNMNYAISYLHASDLPADVSQKIKAIYPSDDVFSVKEVKADHINVLEVILENAKEFTVLSISDNGLSEVKRTLKS